MIEDIISELNCNIIYYLQMYGIPAHYKLNYAMGISLVAVGVMTAFYHVCPNRHNFLLGMKMFLSIFDVRGKRDRKEMDSTGLDSLQNLIQH